MVHVLDCDSSDSAVLSASGLVIDADEEEEQQPQRQCNTRRRLQLSRKAQQMEAIIREEWQRGHQQHAVPVARLRLRYWDGSASDPIIRFDTFVARAEPEFATITRCLREEGVRPGTPAVTTFRIVFSHVRHFLLELLEHNPNANAVSIIIVLVDLLKVLFIPPLHSFQLHFCSAAQDSQPPLVLSSTWPRLSAQLIRPEHWDMDRDDPATGGLGGLTLIAGVASW
ncbi:hypothetical protein BC827DRAFT_1158532 [Russula dissimulans]|nr:hypothetical protein BC827DRAFT_1158532 [Russula dissimulans]